MERATFHRLMVETEIGLLLGRALEVPVSDPAALRRSIGAVVPVIELPDFGFADGARLEGVDIVAANVLAGKFIVGEPKPLSDIDLDEITVSLSLDGQEIHVGKGADTYGDQWRAALWLVDRVMAQGWRLEAGQILLTGVLGKILPGSPGKYVADYGRLGKVLFEVE